MSFQQPRITFSNPKLNRGVVEAAEFASLYEAFNPLTTVNKQHFVEWFSGDALDTIWTQRNNIGSGTFGMVDAVDEGFFVKSDANVGDDSNISMNNINHYKNNASVFIGVTRNVSGAALIEHIAGLVKDHASFGNNDVALMHMDTGFGPNVHLWTANTSAQTLSSTGIAVHTNWQSIKIENKSADTTLDLDGVLRATNTTTLPSADLQPMACRALSQTTGAKESRVRYCEVYNT